MAWRLKNLKTKCREILDDIAYVMQVGRFADTGIFRRVAVHGMSEHDPVRWMGIHGDVGILFENSRNSIHVVEMSMRQKNGSQTKVPRGKKRKQKLRVLSGIKDKRIVAVPKNYTVCLVRTDRDYLV